MKRNVVIMLVVCILALSLASCDNNRDSKKVMNLIASVTDADSCYTAADAYYALTEEEQKAIPNAYALKNHMKTYASDARIRDYLMKDDAAQWSKYFHNRLRNKLLNIDSYTVNSQTTVVFYDGVTDNYYLYIKIDYSAQNRAGGYTRYENNANYYVWDNTSWSILPTSSDEDWEVIKSIYTWQFSVYRQYEFTYTAE